MRGPARAAWAIVALAAPGLEAGQLGARALSEAAEMGKVRVIVALREPSVPLGDLGRHNEAVRRTQASVLGSLGPGEFLLTHRWESIPAVAGVASLSGLARLAADPDVLQVDVDEPAYMASDEAAALMRVDEVRGRGVTGKGVVVAVLDTGVDTDHPDIRDSLVGEACFCTSPSGAGCCPSGAATQAGAGSSEDDQGHGTNVTGVITSDGRVAPQGIAPDAQIVAIKVLDRTGAGSSSGILSGLDHVINARREVKVVNLSLGLGNLFAGFCDSAASFTTSFASAINTLRSRNVSVFAASANNANSSQIAVPACIRNAIAVGAVYDGDTGTVTFGCTDGTTRADQVACFSNSSSAVDVMAPGAPITSAGLGGGVSTFFGTSQACPAAAGVAALLLEANPALGVDALENALKNGGVNVTDPKNGLSFRRIDASAALGAVR